MRKKNSYFKELILNANRPKKRKNNILLLISRNDKPSVDMIFASCP